MQTQQTAPNTIVISDTSKKSGGVSNGLTDRVTLLDGSVLVGKITEISGTKIVIKVSGLDYVVEPGRVARIERNINQDSLGTQHRNVVVKTKDGSQFRGILKRSDNTNTYVEVSGSEIPVRNDSIESIEYLDNEQVRQNDAIAARPSQWEITLKGGSMLTQIGTFSGLLSPGYFGLLQVEYPAFQLPYKLRIAPGLQAGFIHNAGKSASNTTVRLLPGLVTATLSYQLFNLPVDIFGSGLFGANLTRGTIASGTEKLSLDLAYGAELGVKYYLNTRLNFCLAGVWLAVSEKTATLNHIGAYASVGIMF